MRRADGTLAATPATRGTAASCAMNCPSRGAIASYHTHGSFSARYDNEVPSTSDLQSDFDFNVDGYVSTPGGRLQGALQVQGQVVFRSPFATRLSLPSSVRQ